MEVEKKQTSVDSLIEKLLPFIDIFINKIEYEKS